MNFRILSKMNMLLVALILFLAAGHVAEAELVLVENGEPKATILLGKEPSAQAIGAAQTLQTYLERISGATLEIRHDNDADSGARIFVGRSKAVKRLGVKVPSGFTNQMNEEGFVIKTVKDALVLAGNEDWQYRGTTYAVNEFLESLGCRWFFPGTYGEVVPTVPTIAVGDIDRTERPDFRFRNLWYSGWQPASSEDQQNLAAWMDHNKVNSLAGLSLPGDGTITRLAPADKYFESHPDIYAVNERGERVKEMLCLTEPETVRIAIETIKETFRNDPNAVSFGFGPPDGHPMCHCHRCQARIPGFMGKGYGDPSLSDAWFKFVNEIATEVYREFPDRWLLTNGYANRVRPPEGVGPLSPNIGIQSAMIASCTFHRIGEPRCWQRQLYEQVLNRWTDDLRCVFIYDYDPGKGLEGLPFPMLHNLGPDMRYFKERGIWGFWTEANNSWMITHLNYYVRAKLMWDVERSVEDLVRDYCRKFYGQAAAPIEEYMWTLENAVDGAGVHETWGRLTPYRQILVPETMTKLDSLITTAQERAKDAPEALHAGVLAQVHDHMKAYVEMDLAASRGAYQEAVSLADSMLAIRDELGKTDPALLPHTPEWCRDSKTTLEWHRKLYQRLADRAGGEKGELVALLPERWEFKLDPEDIGVIHQWYLQGNGGTWDEIDATTYWQAQGYQDEKGWGYAGKAWYRTSFPMPKDFEDKKVKMAIGGVYSTDLWVWVNGMLVKHLTDQNPRNPFDVDVSDHVKPGETNSVAILVSTGPPDRNPRGGLHRRAFLWCPK